MPPKRRYRRYPPGSTIPLVPPLDASEWEEGRRPAIEYRRSRKPYIYRLGQSVKLLDLPQEILDNILEHISDWEGLIDITLKPKHKRGGLELADEDGGTEILRSKWKFGSLVHVNKELQNMVAAFINYDFGFLNKQASTISRLPQVFEKMQCELIQRLEVEACYATKNWPDKVWPSMLDVIEKHLPNLSRLSMYTMVYMSDMQTPTLQQEIYAPLLGFMAVVTCRRPDLGWLILPAGSDPCFDHKDDLDHSFAVYIDVEKADPKRSWNSCKRWVDDAETQQEIREDEILDASTIRAQFYDELLQTPIENFFLQPAEGLSKNTITSSNIRKSPNVYQILDDRGYRTYQEHNDKKWLHRTRDELVKMCRNGDQEIVARDAAKVNARLRRERGRRERSERGRGIRGGRGRGRGGYSRGA